MTEEESKFCEYKLGVTGDFFTSLIDTFWLADTYNKNKLITVFPVLLVAYKFSNEEGYWQKLLKKWNKKHPNNKLTI